MVSRLALVGLVALASLPMSALAQEAAVASEVVRFAEPPKDGARFRFGIAGTVAGGLANAQTSAGNHVSAGVLAPGLQLDLGVQFNSRAALYLRGEVNSVAITNGASAYLVAEWTPMRGFSVGTGLGVDAMAFLWAAAVEGDNSYRNSWAGISVPLVLGYQVVDRDQWEAGGRKRVFRIGLELAGGVEPRSWVPGWHANLSVGFTLM